MFYFTNLTNVHAAAGGGGHSLGGLLIFTSPSQDDLNTLIERANQREGGISTKSLGQGYELSVNYEYRFSGTMFSVAMRPSYFMQSSKGSGNGKGFDYILSGWSLFPMLKLTPLENSFIKFYMQVGLGYGRLNGLISESGAMAQFTSGTFGGSTGLGAEFCFTPEHCMMLEGNLRYLPFERNKASSVVGGSFVSGSLSQAANGQEVEIDNVDLATTMSGVQGTLGYMYHF